MTTLNTIIEEEKKLVSTIVKVRRGSMDDKQFEATVTHVLTTAMQRVAEAVRVEERLRAFEILHTYAMKTKTSHALDLIEEAQQEILHATH